jgi:hypothetical protein
MHGRDAFDGDRWLQRVYIRSNLEAVWALTANRATEPSMSVTFSSPLSNLRIGCRAAAPGRRAATQPITGGSSHEQEYI